MKNFQLQTLQKHLDEINKTKSKIKDEIDSVEIAIDCNDLSKLLSATSNVQIYRNLPQKIKVSFPQFTSRYIQGKYLRKYFGTLSLSYLTFDTHGYSMKTSQKSPEAGSSPPVKQLLDQPKTIKTIDTGYESYYVTCVSDEEILTSGYPKTLKLHIINQGSLLKSFTTKSGKWPPCIAVTKSGDLVYTDYDDRTVNIVKNKTIEVIRLQNWRPRCVCSTSSGDLLLTMHSNDNKQTKVVRYFGSTEKQTIQFDNEGKPLYSPNSNEILISENKNLDICVSDNIAKAVVVVDQAGKLRFRYTGHTPAPKNEPYNPQGIATDSQCHILTSDWDNGCVHIIAQDGQFLRYIECELSYPRGLCTDTNDNLFVAQWVNKQVKKIKYLL
ncbi:tripartite motif-containing protein 3-like [Saccostrea cucullata]|uniref:tripartite motif-containing protein 3-like n=1 Tax=Saccostrea cuccullata TaxID=36930 RepID=UPI002ED28254